MSIAVVNSGGANISSVLHALGRLGAEPLFTHDAEAIRTADRVILPGVGAAGNAMDVLHSHGLVDVIRGLAQPVLGICLGMQLLFESSEEDDASLLGLIPARLGQLPGQTGLRVPHMGWNSIETTTDDPLTRGLDGKWFYFVHSFAAPVGGWTLAASTHGQPFSAVVRHDNFTGARLLKNFLETPLT